MKCRRVCLTVWPEKIWVKLLVRGFCMKESWGGVKKKIFDASQRCTELKVNGSDDSEGWCVWICAVTEGHGKSVVIPLRKGLEKTDSGASLIYSWSFLCLKKKQRISLAVWWFSELLSSETMTCFSIPAVLAALQSGKRPGFRSHSVPEIPQNHNSKQAKSRSTTW